MLTLFYVEKLKGRKRTCAWGLSLLSDMVRPRIRPPEVRRSRIKLISLPSGAPLFSVSEVAWLLQYMLTVITTDDISDVRLPWKLMLTSSSRI